jgi:hypothetical protein
MNVHKQPIVVEIYMLLIDDECVVMILLIQQFVEYHLVKNLLEIQIQVVNQFNYPLKIGSFCLRMSMPIYVDELIFKDSMAFKEWI